MKRKMKFSQPFKALFLAGLLASPMLAFKTMAATEYNETWSPLDLVTATNGSTYAYWNDPNNWSGGEVPGLQDTNTSDIGTYYGDYYDAHFDDTYPNIVPCLITNDTEVGQLVIGDYNGAGEVIVTNDATFEAGFIPDSPEWTGVGFPDGPGTLIVGPGCTFVCASHLWVGDGTNSGSAADAIGTVIDNGGTIYIPAGQLGVGWNGSGGTNYLELTNGANLYVDTWTSSTLGSPGNPGAYGILDIESGCSVVVTNNQTSFFEQYVTNSPAQLIGYGGSGTVSWSYNPSLNITTISSIEPVNSNTPQFAQQPTNQVVVAGGTATFQAVVDNVPCNFQWLFNNTPISNGNGISGAQTATLTVANVSLADVGNYSVLATNQNVTTAFAQSQVVSLTTEAVNIDPTIAITGVPNNTYEIQYTTSLTPPVTWTTLGTYTLAGTTAYVTQYIPDTSGVGSKRFYQVIQVPTPQ